MDDFYVGLWLTVACLCYNLIGLFLANYWAENKKTVPFFVGTQLFKAPDSYMFLRKKTVLPPFFALAGFLALLELGYAVLLIVFPEVLGFTLFNKAIDHPFYTRTYSAFIISINFVYLYLKRHFYNNYLKEGNVDNKMTHHNIKLAQIYIIDVIKTIFYILSVIYAHMFLLFEGIITSSYVSVPNNTPSIWFIVSIFITMILAFFYGNKAREEDRYISHEFHLL